VAPPLATSKLTLRRKEIPSFKVSKARNGNVLAKKQKAFVEAIESFFFFFLISAQKTYFVANE
jgi:hypothetical protein